jgi:hypothetical protein
MSRWIAVVGPACLQAHPGRHLGTSQIGKNYLGGLTRIFSAWRAARLIPTAGGLNSVAPAVLEAVNRYVKMLPAVFLDFGFRPVRAIWRRLHLPQQISITIALPPVLGESPWHIADLGEVRRAKIGRARFQAYGEEVNGFRRWHDASKRLNTVRRNLLRRSRPADTIACDRRSD